MGPQYPITLGIGMTVPTWYKLGTLTLASGSVVRMFSLQATTQTYQGVPKQLFLDFVSNAGNPVQDTYDATPVAFNAYTRMQTTSPEWYFDGFSTDVAVTQLSNAVYAFYLIVYPDTGTGFFTVRHAPGDSFLFEGVYTGGTRPANGVYPTGLPVTSVDQIGALPTDNPTATGLLTCQNLRATGTVDLPVNSLAISDVSNLQQSLDSKANASNAQLTGTATAAALQVNGASTLLGSLNVNGFTTLAATTISSLAVTGSGGSNFFGALGSGGGFFTQTGFLTTTSSSTTVYTVGPSQKGLIFLDAEAPNSSSTVCFFSGASGTYWLSIVARNGNALGVNIGTAFSGTWNMSILINSTGAIRVATTSTGITRWTVVLLAS
jgi:hypothetical protein